MLDAIHPMLQRRNIVFLFMLLIILFFPWIGCHFSAFGLKKGITFRFLSPYALRFPICSIILSCCVWISWWTPRTRSFLTCMVPLLRCLLSNNKARAQSEQSPGAAKQTSAISQRATSSCHYKIKSDLPIQLIIWLPFFRPMRRQDNEKFEKYTVMLEEQGQI